uniref:Uncharacterized protein n=1 Tax=Octopus bimaculoides TaxID=37653 RepID=A0A0L8FFV7_OCTBM
MYWETKTQIYGEARNDKLIKLLATFQTNQTISFLATKLLLLLLLLLSERRAHAIKVTLGYKYTKPNIRIITTHLSSVHQAHASQPYMHGLVISYQDKQRMTL